MVPVSETLSPSLSSGATLTFVEPVETLKKYELEGMTFFSFLTTSTGSVNVRLKLDLSHRISVSASFEC